MAQVYVARHLAVLVVHVQTQLGCVVPHCHLLALWRPRNSCPSMHICFRSRAVWMLHDCLSCACLQVVWPPGILDFLSHTQLVCWSLASVQTARDFPTWGMSSTSGVAPRCTGRCIQPSFAMDPWTEPHTDLGVFCLLRGGVGLEYGLVSLGLHCFLRLERALCWRSGRCLAGVVAFSV